ncbi:MAG: aminotransferase class IV [Prolixibacteraceae bacterium]|nr:aminotransferase class IV [Prolixibacteraceae bacterium]
MCRLVESIRIENRQLQHVDLHNKRFYAARKKLFGCKGNVDLSEMISIPASLTNARYKCRVITNGENFQIEINPYTQRTIKSLKVVFNNHIDYPYKYENRSEIMSLYKLRGKCDDILIVKNNNLTDSSAANVLLFDGSKWVTPSTPLLKGVQRQYLLNAGSITEQKLTIADLHHFQTIKLVNAMIDFKRAPLIDVHSCVCFDSSPD